MLLFFTSKNVRCLAIRLNLSNSPFLDVIARSNITSVAQFFSLKNPRHSVLVTDQRAPLEFVGSSSISVGCSFPSVVSLYLVRVYFLAFVADFLLTSKPLSLSLALTRK